ncbi:hypothetical protein [Nostoc sp.]|uniref:hypothetical protein n=1 Tax=Nostoc sp. TaxID=1180 RepID=UPI002FFBB241
MNNDLSLANRFLLEILRCVLTAWYLYSASRLPSASLITIAVEVSLGIISTAWLRKSRTYKVCWC